MGSGLRLVRLHPAFGVSVSALRPALHASDGLAQSSAAGMEEGSEESEGGASPLASSESSCMEPAASFTASLSSGDTRGDRGETDRAAKLKTHVRDVKTINRSHVPSEEASWRICIMK